MLLMVGGRGRVFSRWFLKLFVCVIELLFSGYGSWCFVTFFCSDSLPSLVICAHWFASVVLALSTSSPAHISFMFAVPHPMDFVFFFFIFFSSLVAEKRAICRSFFAGKNQRRDLGLKKKKRRLEICPKEERSIQPTNKKKVHQSRIKQLHTVVVRVALFFFF